MTNARFQVIYENKRDELPPTLYYGPTDRGEALEIVERDFEAGARTGRAFKKISMHTWRDIDIFDEVRAEVKIEVVK